MAKIPVIRNGLPVIKNGLPLIAEDPCECCTGDPPPPTVDLCGCTYRAMRVTFSGYADCDDAGPPLFEHRFSNINGTYELLPEFDEFDVFTGFHLAIGEESNCDNRGIEYDRLYSEFPFGDPLYEEVPGYLFDLQSNVNCFAEGDDVHFAFAITAGFQNYGEYGTHGDCEPGSIDGTLGNYEGTSDGCEILITDTITSFPLAPFCGETPTITVELIPA